jgi:sterol desaturase/sphingolipid hydroxylase (fatty acid hydroxylase superfamily)
MMAEGQQKSMRLLAYWLFSMVVMVFAAITAYIALWVRPAGASMWTIVKSGFPIWGITGLAAVIIFAGYYFYSSRRAKTE